MATKIKSYVDSAAFIATFDVSDSHHPLFKQLFADPPALCTSALVITESHGWFLRRFDQTRGLQFLQFVHLLPGLSIIECDSKALAQATKLLQRFSDQRLSMADAHGLAIMQERKIRMCWSTDHHLGLTGVPLAIHAL